MPFKVQQLIGDRQKPLTVAPDDPAQTALEQMIEYDYSQLPIVTADNKPLGMITSDSILRALNHFGITLAKLRVSHATVKTPAYRAEDDLFDLLDALRDRYAVLITDSEGCLTGIVTDYDTTDYFRRLAEDMMIIEDIELGIRDQILGTFTNSDGELDQGALDATSARLTSSPAEERRQFRRALQQYLSLQKADPVSESAVEQVLSQYFPEKPANKSFEALNFSDYMQLVLHKSRWAYFENIFHIEPDALRKLLDDVRQTRNLLAHFHGEPSPKQRDQLRFCQDLLARHQRPLSPAVSAAVATLDTSTAASAVNAIPATTGSTEEPTPGEILPLDEAVSARDSRYTPLSDYLQTRPPSQDGVLLHFAEVEQLMGDRLPASARAHRTWWANAASSHTQARSWLEVGWQVANIDMTEETVVFARIKERAKAYIAFFRTLMAALGKAAPFPVLPASPDADNWHKVAGLPDPGPQVAMLVYSFSWSNRFRVELYIDTGNQARNKAIYDSLLAQQDKIKVELAELGEQLSWERMPERRASRIALYHPGSITDSEENLAHLRTWATGAMIRFWQVLAGRVQAPGPDTPR